MIKNIECQYLGIERACVEIAYDNGGVNRLRTEDQMRKECREFLSRSDFGNLPEIDEWLNSKSDEFLREICSGEQSEIENRMKDAPPFTDSLLNQYFTEVC